MLKPFSAALLVLGTTAAWAVDEPPQPAIVNPEPAPVAAPAAFAKVGFELSFAYVMPNDRRFTGSAVGYYLFVPFGNDVELGLYRQEGFYHGRDGDESIFERGHFDAVRATYRFFDDEVQCAKLIAAAGYSQFTTHLPVGAFAFDLGVEYNPWKINVRPASSEFGVSLVYRYCRFGDVDVLGGRPVNDAGGLLVGVHGIVTF